MTSDRAEAHLTTEHIRRGLKGHAVSSTVVTAWLQVALFAIHFAGIMILARLLTPDDFGVVGMTFALMSFLRVFSEAGLATVTVQREELTTEQVTNLFWTNVTLGVAMSVVLVGAAPAAGWIFREPRVVAVTMALGGTFALASVYVQHVALLRRQMRFSAIACVEIGSAFASLVMGTTLAILGYGYWSLVGMQLAAPAVGAVVAWTLCRWRPGRPARGVGTGPLFRFGATLTASSVMWSLARGLDGLLIGRWFGTESLGLYSRASALMNRPLEQAIAPLGGVFMPALARVQTEPERYRRAVLELHGVLTLMGVVGSALALAAAEPLTLVVLGSSWVPAVPIVQVMTSLVFYLPCIAVAGWVLLSQGRGRDQLILSCCTSSITATATLVGAWFGVVGVALGLCLSSLLVQLPVTYWIAGRSGRIRSRDFWRALGGHVPLWGVIFGAAWLVGRVITAAPPLADLCLRLTVGIFAAALAVWSWPPSRRSLDGLISLGRQWAARIDGLR